MAGEEAHRASSREEALRLVERAAERQAVTLYAAIRLASEAGASAQELAEASGLSQETIARLLGRKP